MWTPSLCHQVSSTRLPLSHTVFCVLLQGCPWRKASLLSISLSQVGRDLQLTRSPKGSTHRKVLKNNYLYQQYINYCPENNFIKPVYTSKYSHHYLVLSEKHLNHPEKQVAARKKYTKIKWKRIPRIWWSCDKHPKETHFAIKLLHVISNWFLTLELAFNRCKGDKCLITKNKSVC